MLFCKQCHNLMVKNTSQGKLLFECPTCNNIEQATPSDTLIHYEDKGVYQLRKSGKTIYHYPSNPKIELPCPKCKAGLVGWERDLQLNKIYGCKCGYTWTSK